MSRIRAPRRFRQMLPMAAWLLGIVASSLSSAAVPDRLQDFLELNCVSCHEGEFGEGGFDATAVSGELQEDSTRDRWIRIFDRVQAGEMPPAEAGALPAAETTPFLSELERWIGDHQRAAFAERGRVQARRLTDLQLERTLHDLLGIDVPLAAQLPEESTDQAFPTIAAGQSMSHFQLQQHLRVVDLALDEAFRRATTPADQELRELAAEDVVRSNPKRRCREPEMLDGNAVVWNSGLIFYGRLPVTTAKEAGWYRFTIKASSLKAPEDHGVWCTVRTGRCVSSAPLLEWVGAFEATEEADEWTFETWLPRGDMLEVRPGDETLKKGRFRGGQVGAGEGGPQDVPGLAIHSVRMERIHRGPDDRAVRSRLFGELLATGDQRSATDAAPRANVKEAKAKEDAASAQDRSTPGELQGDVSPAAIRARLVKFAEAAFRRPVEEASIEPYAARAIAAYEAGEPLVEVLRGAYRSLLCSPRFLYFHERPGQLDDFALASRLSYFLWNSMPDAELRRLAAAGTLSEPEILHGQLERMLAAPRGAAFIRDFAADWLDLKRVDFNSPDRRRFPDFDLIVRQSMLAETHAFLEAMLTDDLSVTRLIDSDFTYLNSRLARYYKLDPIAGDALRKVKLDRRDHRGGVLTQGAILKVTANGTNTSPVIRGAWVAERLLGLHIPPPPTNVPAIEPDTRGATTIREQLEKHRSNASCASCHRKMDPPGFALENFDAAGKWRERYYRRGGKGLPVDPSYVMADGRAFEGVDEFRQRVLERPAAVARCVAEHLLSYGTGATVQFADRAAIETIVEEAKTADYGFRSLLHAVVASPVFQAK